MLIRYQYTTCTVTSIILLMVVVGGGGAKKWVQVPWRYAANDKIFKLFSYIPFWLQQYITTQLKTNLI